MLIAGTVTVRSVGAPAVPSVLGALAITGAVCLLTLAHAQRLGVSVTQPRRLLRRRMLPHALVLALVAGVLHAGGEAGSGSSPKAQARYRSTHGVAASTITTPVRCSTGRLALRPVHIDVRRRSRAVPRHGLATGPPSSLAPPAGAGSLSDRTLDTRLC